jgi:hypothetical protein
MHKNATKCNETLIKWCKNKHGASKIMDTLETYQNAGSVGRSRDGPASEEAPTPGLPDPEAAAARAARVFLFLLPGGRPRRRPGGEATASIIAAFFPLPFGRPGPRFLGTSMSPTAGAAPMEAVTAGTAAVAAARAAKVFWLRPPNGRPRLCDTGGVAAGILTFFPLPFGAEGSLFLRGTLTSGAWTSKGRHGRIAL